MHTGIILVNRLTARLGIWGDLFVGRILPASHSQRRYAHIARSTLAACLSKGAAVLVGILSVSLTTQYLGAELYGLWMTISTMLAWLSLADLGISNSLTNALAGAYGTERRDLAQRYVASAFWLLSLVAVAGAAVLVMFAFSINWGRVLSIHSPEAQSAAVPALLATATIFVANLPFSITTRILLAYEEGPKAHFWLAAGSIANVLGLIVATRCQLGLAPLIVASSGASLLVAILSGAWLFLRHKPWLMPKPIAITKESMRKLASLGGQFFLVQIAALLVIQTDNLIIAHYLGISAVTPYSVTWRLFTYSTFLQVLFAQSLWPAYAEASARGDGMWIKRTLRLSMMASVFFTLMIAVPLVFFGSNIIRHWAGGDAIPGFRILVWMGIWSVLSAFINPVICMLNGVGRIRGQMFYGLATAAANIVLSIFLVKRIGLEGVILGTLLAYLVFGIAPLLIETKIVIKSLPSHATVS